MVCFRFPQSSVEITKEINRMKNMGFELIEMTDRKLSFYPFSAHGFTRYLNKYLADYFHKSSKSADENLQPTQNELVFALASLEALIEKYGDEDAMNAYNDWHRLYVQSHWNLCKAGRSQA